jgi:nitrate reductase gamma subunit
MQTLIEFGRGPLFRFAVAIAILGLARHVVLTVYGAWQLRRRVGDKRIDFGAIFLRTIQELNPLRYFLGSRAVYSVLSTVFHVGLILVPVFYLGHIRLWREGLGFGWPAMGSSWADGLTVVTVVTGLLLLVARGWSPASRSLSRLQDWALPALIAAEFVTGYLLAHPGTTRIGLPSLLLVHVWVGDALLLLTPFSKIVHCVMLPFSRLVSEMGWRFIPGVGGDVIKTIGKERTPI